MNSAHLERHFITYHAMTQPKNRASLNFIDILIYNIFLKII